MKTVILFLGFQSHNQRTVLVFIVVLSIFDYLLYTLTNTECYFTYKYALFSCQIIFQSTRLVCKVEQMI